MHNADTIANKYYETLWGAHRVASKYHTSKMYYQAK